MYLIEQITDDPLQQQILVLPDGSTLLLQISFKPLQYGWFINSLTYKTFILNGLRITNSPNFLHQFKNKIPFGLGCFSKDNREPSLQQDFVSGASKLYLLDSMEIEDYEVFLSNG